MTRASRRRRVASLARASAGASSVETSVASTVDASRVERRASTVVAEFARIVERHRPVRPVEERAVERRARASWEALAG